MTGRGWKLGEGCGYESISNGALSISSYAKASFRIGSLRSATIVLARLGIGVPWRFTAHSFRQGGRATPEAGPFLFARRFLPFARRLLGFRPVSSTIGRSRAICCWLWFFIAASEIASNPAREFSAGGNVAGR